MTEVAQLFDLFKGKTLTRAGVERALECHVITKWSKDHENLNLLRRPYTMAKTKFGIGCSEMPTAEAGGPMEWICPQCLTPRPQLKPTCMFCKSTEAAVHRTEPTARMCVDGVNWELRFDDAGCPHWDAPGVTSEQKEAASVDVGQMAQAPSQAWTLVKHHSLTKYLKLFESPCGSRWSPRTLILSSWKPWRRRT